MNLILASKLNMENEKIDIVIPKCTCDTKKIIKENHELIYMKDQIQKKYEEEKINCLIIKRKEEDLLEELAQLKAIIAESQKKQKWQEYQSQKLHEMLLSERQAKGNHTQVHNSETSITEQMYANMKSEIAELTEKCKLLTIEVTEYKTKYDKVSQENGMYKQSSEKLEGKLKDLQEKYSAILDENRSLLFTAKDIILKMSLTEEKDKKMEREFEEKSQEVKSKENLITKLEENAKEYRMKNENNAIIINDFMEKVNHYQQEKEKDKIQLSQLNTHLASMNSENLRMTNLIMQLKTSNEILAHDKNIIIDMNNKIRSQNSDATLNEDPNKISISDQLISLNSIIAILTRDNESYLQEIKRLNNEIHNFQVVQSKDNVPLSVKINKELHEKKEKILQKNFMCLNQQIANIENESFKEKMQMQENIKELASQVNSLKLEKENLAKELKDLKNSLIECEIKNKLFEKTLCEMNITVISNSIASTEIQEDKIKNEAECKNLQQTISIQQGKINENLLYREKIMDVIKQKDNVIMSLSSEINSLTVESKVKGQQISEYIGYIEQIEGKYERIKNEKQKLLDIIHKKASSSINNKF